jgi:L-ribulose-5-phosphate 4-epimerase
VLEQLAKMNFLTHMLDSKATRIEQFLLDKHFLRKHGKKAYYGQKNK